MLRRTFLTLLLLLFTQLPNILVQLPRFIEERHQLSVWIKKGRAQGDWACPGTLDHAAAHAAHFRNPPGKLRRISDCRREQQEPHARWRQYDCLFPNVPA